MKFNNLSDCTWANDHYYILKNTNTVEIYNNNFELIKEFSMGTDYGSITYNDKKKYFYFSIINNSKLLHKSCDFKNFKPLELDLSVCSEKIKNIYYCKCLGSLLITTTKRILILDLTNNHISVLFQVKENISKFSDCTRPLERDIDSNILLIASICCCKEILVVYRVGKISFISKLKDGKIDDIVYKTNDFIKSVFIKQNELWLLVDNQCYQELVNTRIKCICSCPKDCGCDIVESIAFIEKSIAKILDSESLKIKVAIDKSEDVNDLICINSSVKEVIYYVTILEFILTEKLKMVKKERKKDCECQE